jgi:hypothetical protein
MFSLLPLEIKPLLPGAIGAALAAVTGPERSRTQRCIEFAAGFCIALFFTEPTLDFFKLTSTYSGPIGFSLGYFGMTMAHAILGALRDTNWVEVIKRRIGGGQ